jgi:hypothetical protein
MQFAFIFLSLVFAAGIREPQPTREDCRQGIVTHQPDKSVTYQAGSTASGKKVEPADLFNNRDFGLGKNAVIPLDIPLQDYAQSYTATPNGAVNATVNDSKIYTGIVDMKGGKIRINGESVYNVNEEKLREECKKLYPDLE